MLWAVPDGELEVRRAGGRITITGNFNYGSTATLRAGGRNSRPLKERFESTAFDFSIDDPERDINLLYGHDWSKPLASQKLGTLKLDNTREALRFEATLSDEMANTTHARDAIAMMGAGLSASVSPGFLVPDIEGAQSVSEEDPAEGRALIRTVHKAVLREVSIVTNPAYSDTSAQVEARSWDVACTPGLIVTDFTSPNYRWRR